MAKSRDVQMVVAIQDKSVAILANETAIPMIIADMEATTSTKMIVVKKRMNDGSIRYIEKYKTSFSPMIR